MKILDFVFKALGKYRLLKVPEYTFQDHKWSPLKKGSSQNHQYSFSYIFLPILFFTLHIKRHVKPPTTITMVNHLFCHATVNTDVFTCDKACFFRAKKQYHIGNIHRISDTMNRLLQCNFLFAADSYGHGKMKY